MKKLLLLILAFVAIATGSSAATDYGFSIRGYKITSDNYQSQSSGAAWSYDPAANVLHLKEGTIISDATSGIDINGNINPTLNVSVDGNCTLSGKFDDGIFFTGNGNHTFSGTGTLTIWSSVVSSTGILAGSTSKPNVTFKDLSIRIKQYGGVGFNASYFASITFEWCDFDINTSDGMAMRGNADTCTPHLILCFANRGWGSPMSDYKGYSGQGSEEGPFAPNVKITRAIKYVGVNIAEPAPGQKPATTATTISPAYKVTSITWTKQQYGYNYPMEENETFKIGQIYRASFELEAQGDSLFDYTDDGNAAAIVTVNGNKPEFFRANNDKAAYINYTFPEVDGTRYYLWVGGVQVTETNKDDILENGIASYNPSTNTLILKGGTINGQSGANDGTTGFGAGIYSEIDGLIINVINEQGGTTVKGVGGGHGIYLRGKTTINGNGVLFAIGYTGIYLGTSSAGTADLTVDGNVVLMITGNQSQGIGGYMRGFAGNLNYYCSLTIKGDAVVNAYGTSNSIGDLKSFVLKDSHAITSPEGAVWNADKHAVCDASGNPITGKWIEITKVPNPYDLNNDGKVSTADIQVIINEMKKPQASQDMKYDLNNDGKISTADIQVIINEMKK